MKNPTHCFMQLALLSVSTLASAQAHVLTPDSSFPHPRNKNVEIMMRTHLRLLVPDATRMNFGPEALQPDELPPFAGFLFETPASLGCIYKLVPSPLTG